MQRYFISEEKWYKDEVHISGDDAHHIIRVMRLKEGDQLICNHPDGRVAICEITAIDNDMVQVSIKEWLEESVELPVDVIIAQGLPKSDKLELVLQKGTELGAAGFIPIQADRSVVKWDMKKAAKKMQRFEKIMKEASEQSHRNRIPNIMPIQSTKELVQQATSYDVRLFAYEDEAKRTPSQLLRDVFDQIKPGQTILLFIGPEGGFSNNEVNLLLQNGFNPIRLGPRILRTETAPLYVLATISYHFEESGCP
ncbi:16S rRNA (uracil(1498)-N(3))-methyltransferase [Oceanobacillus halotolerans]|uniref:16S rRNA (uracil(1498)-N(3))-methyltransferase n=1 Tax=Oceanobacillus halotolerans TaxID=2663380 RepID=UPI0013DA1891|nr:16S rRNA (uracil(1498)-N(3))-methyltransferase [Oceanobacillus halotolerans]